MPWSRLALAYALAAGGLVVGWILWKSFKPGEYVPKPGISAFAMLYIFAQSIERILDPFSTFVGSVKVNGEKVTKKAALAELATSPGPEAKATVDAVRRSRGIVLWGAASGLGMLSSGAFGIFLLHAAGLHTRPIFDILVSGFAIGSGTKPLHDLISHVQKSKEAKEDAAAATGA